jgi:phosphoribosylformylglycinamidine synthase
MHAFLPIVELNHKPEVRTIDLDVSDDELVDISKRRVLALSLDEMKIIRDYYTSSEIKSQRVRAGLPESATVSTDVV